MIIVASCSDIRITRSADWRIVLKFLAVKPLTLKSASAALRSPVDKCGKLTDGGDPVIKPTPSDQAAAVLTLIDKGVIGRDEPDVMRGLKAASKEGGSAQNRQQRNASQLKPAVQAPSARMTKAEQERIPKISFDLAQEGISPERWELDELAREATVIYGDKKFSYSVVDEWPGYL